jgi:hypothetical protein
MLCFQNPEEWRYFTASHQLRRETIAARLQRPLPDFDLSQ